jgi:bifunctional UDP-N-acetylglucosamine pyrophosphorylase/glucosamine-1-phosphate N-acetyltransferase
MAVKALVLGAGKGTRMRSDRAKVLHEVAGRPLIGWMLNLLDPIDPSETVVVVGHQADAVTAALPDGVRTALQADQRGTGHAARVGLAELPTDPGDVVVVLPGDMPLIRPESLTALIETHRQERAAATMLTISDGPRDFGRIVRGDDGIVAIVEARDATPEQYAIGEVNTSVYAFDADQLRSALGELTPDNDQGELYLTDVIAILVGRGARIAGVHVADAQEAIGVNSHDQLAEVAAALRRRINAGWMERGVSMQDPERTYIDATVRLEAGAHIRAEVHLEGETTVAVGAEVGPSVTAVDSTIGPGARVWYSVLRQADVGADAEVGPYVSLRPGARLLARSKAGTFVEIKNSEVGEESKVPHLSYVGDTTIGRGSNVGAGTIVANYDGYEKHRTVIGDGVKVGSDNVLVAPVTLGDDSWTAAGTVVTRDVEPGSLAVGRSPQKEVPGYAARRRARAEQEQS